MTKTRLRRWEKEHRDLVLDEAARLYEQNPQLDSLSLLRQAQRVLPQYLHREIPKGDFSKPVYSWFRHGLIAVVERTRQPGPRNETQSVVAASVPVFDPVTVLIAELKGVRAELAGIRQAIVSLSSPDGESEKLDQVLPLEVSATIQDTGTSLRSVTDEPSIPTIVVLDTWSGHVRNGLTKALHGECRLKFQSAVGTLEGGILKIPAWWGPFHLVVATKKTNHAWVEAARRHWSGQYVFYIFEGDTPAMVPKIRELVRQWVDRELQRRKG